MIIVISGNNSINFKNFLIHLQGHTEKMNWSKHARTADMAKRSMMNRLQLFPSLLSLTSIKH